MSDTITATPRLAHRAGAASTLQARRALAIANARRCAVADLKARVRRGELTVTEIILDAPEEARRCLLFDVVLWGVCDRSYGRAKLRALNARAIRRAEVNLASDLGSLTERQRHWLAAQLNGR